MGSKRRRSGEEAGREKRGVEGGNQVQRRRTGGVGQCEDLGSGKGRPREQTGVVYIFNMKLRSIQRLNFLLEAHIYKLGLEINPKGWHLQTTWAGQYVDVAPRTPNKRSA